jgi:mono/diheme cytochrome c family protein
MRMMITVLAAITLSATGGLAADAKAGKEVYDKSCKSCHGPDGAPVAAIAKMMKVEMKDLKSTEVQKMSDPDMKTAITDGKGKMKPIKTVTGKSLDDVVAYVKTLR